MKPFAARRARILVVEDEALIAEEIAERLLQRGYEVVGGEATAEGAVRAARELAPDLVLMDIRLRGVADGIQAAERIALGAGIPIVYLTAHSDKATLDRAKKTAPFGYVLKPFQEQDLVVAIEIALQRHLVERRLRESEARYATTLSSIGDGVVATDRERRVTFMNPAAEALTGWPAAEAEGRPVEEVMRLVLDPRRPAPHPIVEALRLGAAVHLPGELDLVDRRGAAIPIEDSAAPIVDEGGETTGAVMAFRDCREKRAARESLRRAEERLREAQRMEAVGRLAGGVAHDFNNMLTVILGCCEMLENALEPGGVESALVHDVLEAARRAAGLTDQLLGLSRQRVLRPRTVELGALVRGLEGLMRRLLGGRVELDLAEGPGPLHVSVDTAAFEQALVNLVKNARDAMQPDGGRLGLCLGCVEVSSEPEPALAELAPGRYATLEVKDNGHGMDEATRRRAFEPFFTTKPVGQGTGLGLATVYGMVKQSGGHLSVASAPGRGTALTIYLPAVEEPRPTGAAVEEPRAGQVRGRETVLVVENDPALRRMAVAGLRSYGYAVLEAVDGEEALRTIEAEPRAIDLLVTDMLLPGWTARHVAELLHSRRPGLRVLYLSGPTDDEILLRELVDTRVALLRKPFTPADLARRVREVMERPAP